MAKTPTDPFIDPEPEPAPEPIETAPPPVAPAPQPMVLTIGPEFIDGFAKANAAATKAVTHPENATAYVSVFNPLGLSPAERPKLSRDTYWKGYRLQEEELKPNQIALLNRLTGGAFREGKWVVHEVVAKPGQRGRIDVQFPAEDIDSRMELPRTMEEMCLEMLGEASRATEFTHLGDAQAEITRLRMALDAATV